jgi:hypothetical protein
MWCTVTSFFSACVPQFHLRVECTRLNEASFCHFMAMCAAHGYFGAAESERAKDVMGRLRRAQWQVMHMQRLLGPLAASVLQRDARPVPRDAELPAVEGVLRVLLGAVVERFAVLAAPEAATRGAPCLPPPAFAALVQSLRYFRRAGAGAGVAAALRAPSVVAAAAAAPGAPSDGELASGDDGGHEAAAAAAAAAMAVPGGVTADAARLALTSLMRAEFTAMGGPAEGFFSALCDTPGERRC